MMDPNVLFDELCKLSMEMNSEYREDDEKRDAREWSERLLSLVGIQFRRDPDSLKLIFTQPQGPPDMYLEDLVRLREEPTGEQSLIRVLQELEEKYENLVDEHGKRWQEEFLESIREDIEGLKSTDDFYDEGMGWVDQ